MPDAIRILYLDDEPALLDIGKLLLEKSGDFSVTTVGSASAALDLLKTEQFDAIISDYLLPEMDGLEFLKQVHLLHGQIPFILLTGRGREEVVILALNNGADYYLQKGGNPQAQFTELSHKIRTAVERRTTDRAFKESEEKFRVLAETSPVGIAVIQGDRDVYLNDYAVQMSGYSKEELFSMKFWDIIHPDSREQLKEQGLARQRGDMSPTNYEIKYITKSHEIRWAYLSAGSIMYEGKPAVVVMLVDITERKRAEDALRESEAYLNSIVHGSPMLQFVIDKDHRVISWNKAIEEYSGVKEAEILGTRNLWKVFYDTERPVLADLLVDEKVEMLPEWYQGKITNSRLIKGAYEATDFFPKMSVSGTWLYFTAAPIRNAKDAIIGAVETLIDITERKQADEALQQANRKLNLLTNITRHDINNQLTVILGYVDMLDSKHLDPTLSEYFQTIATATQRISSMIRFMKEYENIGIATPVWQDIQILVKTAVNQAPLGQVRVNNDLPAETEVLADPLIAKVFYNLMDNAIRYGGKITTIRFFIEDRNGDRIIVCEDDGEGVVATDKERIFDRGFGKNTGLGLALSREILDITGISIRETGEPGKGARFEMTVPKGMWRVKGDDN